MNKVWQKLKRFPNTLAILFIKAYKVTISPHIQGCCRHVPSCSEYGLIAFQKYGFFKAFKLTAGRILRCRPGGTHGYDPVP